MRFNTKDDLITYVQGTAKIGLHTVLADESQSGKLTEYYWTGSKLKMVEDDDTSGVVYSVNSCRLDSNNEPNILYEDNGILYMYASANEPLVGTYANNRRLSLTSLYQLDISNFNDGDYVVIYRESIGLVVVNINDVIESKKQPNSLYWLDISVRPYRSMVRISEGIYSEVNFIKLGQISIVEGVVGDIISYATNGINRVSVDVTINGLYRITHNIGSDDILVYGTFDNVSDVSSESIIPTGSSGYQIGVGLFNGGIVKWYYSTFTNKSKTTIDLMTGKNALFHTGQDNGWFNNATTNILFRRLF